MTTSATAQPDPSSTPVTVTLREEDYRFGSGPLTLRLERVDRIRPLHIDGENWYLVVGVEIRWNGIDSERREVLVRAQRIPPSA